MRQAVDALNNRTVRIMPVVKFPVIILASSSNISTSSQPSTSSTSLPSKTALAPMKCVKDSVPTISKSTSPLPAK